VAQLINYCIEEEGQVIFYAKEHEGMSFENKDYTVINGIFDNLI